MTEVKKHRLNASKGKARAEIKVRTRVKKKTQETTAGKTSVKTGGKAKDKGLHSRNLHRQGYDFTALAASYPALAPHLITTDYGQVSIPFAEPQAVLALNAALLQHHYHIQGWQLPEGYLCPPIPGRVDYLHHIADLLAEGGKIPQGRRIRGLDIGTGANGVYPLLGSNVYGWQFVGADINPEALDNVAGVLLHNSKLASAIELRLQPEPDQIFHGLLQTGECFDFSLCNPPFHASAADALSGSERKQRNLAASRGEQHQSQEHKLNFGGCQAELWCDGGEQGFLLRMIHESCDYGGQVLWFSSLVSKGDNLKPCQQALKQLGAKEVKILEMQQGNKQTRVLAWSFFDAAARRQWWKFKA